MAVVSAAMLRPPGGGLDPPYYQTQRMNFSPTEDKKKSWGQRLKLGQGGGGGTVGPGPAQRPSLYGPGSGPGGSSLSKSMKYAETWLYGTVRSQAATPRPGLYLQYADPQPPVILATPQSPVQNYAVVVCSCQEYLNGTKKGSTKKVSICKKCKGSRLPLGIPVNGTVRSQMMGGTVRGPQAMRSSGGTVRAGTVKLMPTSKSRPTILSLTPQNQSADPYDLMRRTRLSAPLEATHVGSQFTASRSRAKSISPVRNRSRRRSPINDTLKMRSKSVSRTNDLWYEDMQSYENDYNNRRSILECDVNPYDLMQRAKVEKIRHQQEIDDDDVFADFENDETFTLKKLQQNLSARHSKKGAKHNGPYSSVQAIGGQRIRVFGESSTPSASEDFVYDDVEVNNQDYSKNDGQRMLVADAKQAEAGGDANSARNVAIREQTAVVPRSPKVRSASPKRPPRRNKTETSEEESESDKKESEQKAVTKQSSECSGAFVANRSPADPAIKSILKKPRSPQQIASPEPPRSPQTEAQISGSHFYLPTPPVSKSPAGLGALQRKKVQFLVENEIVSSPHRETAIAETSKQTNITATELTSNGADESVKDNNERKSASRGDSHLRSGEIASENGSRNLVNNHNAKNISSNLGFDYGTGFIEARSQPTKGSASARIGKEEGAESADSGCDGIQVRMYSQETVSSEADDRREDSQAGDSQDDSESSSSGRPVSLRRSQSERLIVHGSPESPSFLDTMALRPKPPRAHSRQAFVSTQSLVEIVNIDKPNRPRERPPPPPSPESDKQKSTPLSVTIVYNDAPKTELIPAIPQSDSNLTSPARRMTGSASVAVTRARVSDVNEPPPAQAATEKTFPASVRVNNPLPAPPPRSKLKEIKVNSQKLTPYKKEPNYVKTRFVRDKTSIEEVSKVNFDSEENSSIHISTEAPKRMFGSPGVHRLSITQNDAGENEKKPNEGGHRKTSIMINGDDCYSTVNVNNDTPLYQSSVTVNDVTSPTPVKNTGNTVTISVYSESNDNADVSSRHSNQIYIHNETNSSYSSSKTSKNLDKSHYETASPTISLPGKTLVVVDYETVNSDNRIAKSESSLDESNTTTSDSDKSTATDDSADLSSSVPSPFSDSKTSRGTRCHENISDMDSTSEELIMLLRDPVEAVKRNLVPHVCGKAITDTSNDSKDQINPIKSELEVKNLTKTSFVAKLLEDPMLGHLAEGLDSDLVAKLIENSLLRLKQSRTNDDIVLTEDEETMSRLIDASLLKLQEDQSTSENSCDKIDISQNEIAKDSIVSRERADKHRDSLPSSNRNSICSQTNTAGNNHCSPPYESMEYESGLMGASSDVEPLSDCYNASASELSTEEDNSTRSKFYQMLVDATLSEIEISNTIDDDHHYESIRLNADPIYEEIGDIPPPLPLNPPPPSMTLMDEDKKLMTRSIFEGASKYDILSYLVDAKERGIVPEDSYTFNFNTSNDIIGEEEVENGKESIDHQRQSSDLSSRVSNLSNGSDSSEDSSLIITGNDKTPACKKSSAEIERNDSGVGSETSKCSRSRWQSHNIPPSSVLDTNAPIHLCEDCDGAVETQVTDSGVMYAPLVCRKCGKKRAERKEIITEIVETEEKYGRDLQIILEEFYQPMLVAGLLTQEQLSAIFLNVEELLENNQTLAERLRDALEIAVEQGDEDLLTVNIGKLVLESAPMLQAFSAYCVRQGAASLLLASLEKEKELLRIFLKVSQMENAVLRRMNLNSFLMVPVQRVTKYPLLLSRLFKVTPPQLEGRELLRQAQLRVEQQLTHMNSEARDVTSLRLWRRISSGRRGNQEVDMLSIKLRKMAVDVLEWNHDEARFAMEGKLLFTQPNDNNWRKGRTIKLTPINALLVTNGKPTAAYKPSDALARPPVFPRSGNTGVREAALLLVRDKGGRAALLREPLFLDRCVVAADQDWDDYFELQEIVSKDTYIFKAEDGTRTKEWCQQLQYHSQGMGAWRKRRNALANIMINGMAARN